MMITRATFLFFLFMAGIFPAQTHAQVSQYIQHNDDFFEKYAHESGLFRLLMPIGHKTTTRTMRIGENVGVYASEVTTVHDRRPIHNSVKSYIVRMIQTVGPPMDDDDLPDFLDNVIAQYTEDYRERFGVINKKDRKLFEKRPGIEIAMTYQDPELGEQGLRARVLFSDYSRLEIIHTGPADALYSNQNDRFFKSVEFFNGRVKMPGTYGAEWVQHRPESDVFTAYLPPVTDPYFPVEVANKGGERVELMSARFYDPLWNQFFFYNVHTYRFKAPIDSGNAKKIIYSRHLDKFDVNIRRVKYKTVIEGNDEYFETASRISPPPGFDYLDAIKIRARVYNNVLLVQEMVAPEILLSTAFTNDIFRLTEFHPLGADKGRPMDAKGVPDFITSTEIPEEKKMEESLMDVLGVGNN